ncbi:uncharacterized protein BXZ73DRAFT_54412 [Epithele typhae]|uniref:uncharacterized protein n=1 Tax=Epithele typhae TaxID=378194 RepID=UPI002007AB33|nr:uncharacterized protein BXZ73DRAFT_54412 [Epithele typhae]KAH9915250.1 hypothetical protein BXZ73DRAFT_54412 [Epithele typhae]
MIPLDQLYVPSPIRRFSNLHLDDAVSSRPVPQRVRVPHSALDTNRQECAVSFMSDGALGVSVRDVLKGCARMQEGDSIVLENTSVRMFRLSLEWPGYASSGKYIKVQENGTYITRRELARAICERVKIFMAQAASSSDAMWIIPRSSDNPRISTNNLWLTRVAPAAHRGSWIAQLELAL